MPRTASVVTQSGGQHFYFRYPNDGRRVANSAGRLGVGLDVRADGGYVIGPPSVGPTGRRYEPDDRVRLAETPGWLLERLSAPEDGPRAITPPGDWLNIAAGVPKGQRHASICRFVGHLLRRYIDVALTLQLAHMVNARCHPPLPDREVDRIVEDIAARELRRRQRKEAASWDPMPKR